MFEDTKFVFRCAYRGDFHTISNVIRGYFSCLCDAVIEEVSDKEIKIISYYPLMRCVDSGEVTDIFFSKPMSYEDIERISCLLRALDISIKQADPSVETVGIYARYSFEEMTLTELIRIIKWSYRLQEYNHILVNEHSEDSGFGRLSYDLARKFRTDMDLKSARLLWLTGVKCPIIDVGPALLGDDVSIYTYLGNNVLDLDDIIRYYFCFFRYAARVVPHIPKKEIEYSSKWFRYKLLEMTNGVKDIGTMRVYLPTKIKEVYEV